MLVLPYTSTLYSEFMFELLQPGRPHREVWESRAAHTTLVQTRLAFQARQPAALAAGAFGQIAHLPLLVV